MGVECARVAEWGSRQLRKICLARALSHRRATAAGRCAGSRREANDFFFHLLSDRVHGASRSEFNFLEYFMTGK